MISESTSMAVMEKISNVDLIAVGFAALTIMALAIVARAVFTETED